METAKRGAMQFLLGHLLNAGAKDLDEENLRLAFLCAEQDGIDAAIDFIVREHGNILTEIAHKSRGKLTIIDDEASTSGWKKVLELVLGSMGIATRFWERPRFKGNEYTQEKCDAVLLDLWLPGKDRIPAPSIGFHALQMIREKDPTLPVIVLSSGADTVWALRCLRFGALDYFVRWLPGESEPERWQSASRYLTDALLGAVELGRSDTRWLWHKVSSVQRVLNAAGNDIGIAEELKRMTKLNFGELEGRIFQQLRMSIMLYYGGTAESLSSRLPSPVDNWRVRRLLSMGDGYFVDVILGAGRVVELLGWVACCFIHNRLVSREHHDWCDNMGTYITYAADSAGAAVWKSRNRILHKRHGRQALISKDDAMKALLSSVTAVEIFTKRLLERFSS